LSISAERDRKMKRILFVDDNPRVLEGIRDGLRRHRRDWDMVFTSAATEALSELDAGPFDVVVSDMRMQGGDGATLLAHVRDHFPETARIVLTGYSGRDAVERLLPVAHQFLAKPTGATRLADVVRRVLDVQALVNNPAVRAIAGRVERLPSPPALYTALSRALADPDSGSAEAVAILEQDAAMSAKLLHLANSAFFRTAKRITGIQAAVRHLGVANIRTLVLGLEVFRCAQENASVAAGPLMSLHRHALLVQQMASHLDANSSSREEASMAAFLHDLGLVVLVSELPEELAANLARAETEHRPLYEVEREVLGTTHAELGGYLLGLWGLPYPIVEAVANHHAPGEIQDSEPSLIDVVHVGDALIAEATPPDTRYNADAFLQLSPASVARLGIEDRIDALREVAGALVARQRESHGEGDLFGGGQP